MKVETHNALIDKAKERKNGIYSYKGVLYAVKNNAFVAYADEYGDIYSIHGAFRTKRGRVSPHNRRGALQEFLKSN